MVPTHKRSTWRTRNLFQLKDCRAIECHSLIIIMKARVEILFRQVYFGREKWRTLSDTPILPHSVQLHFYLFTSFVTLAAQPLSFYWASRLKPMPNEFNGIIAFLKFHPALFNDEHFFFFHWDAFHVQVKLFRNVYWIQLK